MSALTNVGIIGFGQMGLLHAGVVNALPGSRLKAICDKESVILRFGKRLLPSVSFYSDYRKMIDSEGLDAVFVTTPPSLHKPIVLDILRRNEQIGIFVEKPLANSFRDAVDMLDAAKKSKATLGVGFQRRFVGTFNLAKRFLDERALGDVQFFRAHFFSSNVLKEGKGWKFEEATGGVALEFAPHLLDLVLWYFGEPASVQSSRKRLYSASVEDYISSYFAYGDGFVGTVEASWSMRRYNPYEMRIEVHGERGMLSVNQDKLVTSIQSDFDGTPKGRMTTIHGSTINQQVPFLLSGPELVIADQTYLSCVASRKPSEPNFESAAKVNKIIDMIRSSPLG